MAAVVPLSPNPQSPEGFYAINNQFLMKGPKGFKEFKMVENDDVFMRMDFPGAPEEGVMVLLDQAKKSLFVYAEAPMVHRHDSSHREYLTSTEIACKCCVFTGFTSHISNGVLRLLLSKTTFDPQRRFPCERSHDINVTYAHGRDTALTGPVLKPNESVIKGSALAYESKELENGSLYVRVDMPGVPKDNFTVSVTNGRVKVTGQAPAVGHDSAGRFYSGDVAMLSSPVDLSTRRIKTIIKNGVIRLLIPPVLISYNIKQCFWELFMCFHHYFWCLDMFQKYGITYFA